MKKITLILLAGVLAVAIFAGVTISERQREEDRERENVLRLHIRAEDDTEPEQALKYAVRDEILGYMNTLTETCTTKTEAQQAVEAHLDEIQAVAQNAVFAEGSTRDVTVRVDRERFDYREYDGFFLPEGEYDAVIVEIGQGQGQNWWCVLFPAVCYAGAGETVRTNAEKMPPCFRLATGRRDDVKVEFKIVNLFRRWFGQ